MLSIPQPPGKAQKPRRPSRYHRRQSRVLWEKALEQLARKNQPDECIASILTTLTAPAIRQLEAEGWPELSRFEDLASQETGLIGMPWTKRQVWYHRQRLQIPARCTGTRIMNAVMQSRRAAYQVKHKLAHLLPDPETGAPGLLLRPRECQILTALRDNGVMELTELLSAVDPKLDNRDAFRSAAGSMFTSLAAAGLIRIGHCGRTQVFTLTEAACDPDLLVLPIECVRSDDVGRCLH